MSNGTIIRDDNVVLADLLIGDKMVERVARIIRDKYFDLHSTELFDAECKELAQWAIAGMREPTEAMLRARGAADAWGDAIGKADEVWRAMIDEALK